MSDDNRKTLCATFETREAAARAVEHLVQQGGIGRSDVFVQGENDNTVGPAFSGGDVLKTEMALRSVGASNVKTR